MVVNKVQNDREHKGSERGQNPTKPSRSDRQPNAANNDDYGQQEREHRNCANCGPFLEEAQL